LSNPQTKEKPEKDKKVRAFALARELNLETKTLLDYAKELGFTAVINQLSGLSPEQVDALKDRAKQGGKPAAAMPGGSAHTTVKPVIPPIAKDNKILTIPKPKPFTKPTIAEAPPEVVAPTAVAHSESKVEAQRIDTPVAELAQPEPTIPESKPSEAAASAVPANVIPSMGGGMRNLGSGVRNLNAPRAATPPAKPASPASSTSQPNPAASSTTPTPTTVAGTAPTTRPAASPNPPTSTPNTGGTESVPTPPAARTPPPNIIPTGGGIPHGRPDVLKRPPQVPPPKLIAPSRTGAGQAPPPSSARTGGGQGQGQGGQRTGGGTPGPRQPSQGQNKPNAGQPMKLTDDMIKRLRDASARGQKLSLNDITRPVAPGTAPAPAGPNRGGESRSGQGSASRIAGRPQPNPMEGGTDGSTPGGDEDDKKKGTGVIGRDSRHKGRQGPNRGRGPGTGQPAIVVGANGQVDIIEQQWGSRRGPRAALLRKHMRGKVAAPIIKEGKIEIALPITVRSLSETIGMKVGDLIKRLLTETSQLYGNNSVIDFDAAALIAVEKNIELVIKKQETKEDVLLERYRKLLEEGEPAKLRPRPPIVTIMGHVDHGKTSLLDKIRQNYGLDSDVVSTEAGGITQVIRAWSVKRDVIVEKEIDGVKQEVQEERFITFLDTPGHEAFTKMRARGANVTDIAVIVVAATDGVRPQTQEAISHAKAAEVKIVVAINKVDMPNANVEKTKRELYNEGLIPDDMGGDVQFIQTSAVTGQGISDLLDTIVLVAEVEELKADPDRPAAGTCLEAYMTGDEGVMATVLIQQGTLHKGDIVLCGSTYGRVRAMYSDMGRLITEAGPSTPVRITGLGNVPNADDPFYVVEELTEAQEIAEDRQEKEREAAFIKRGPQSLDSLKEANAKAKITELKIIVKAEARGSVEAIRKELEKLVHDEVRTRVLHAGIGAITESDVILALTSPDDTLVIGFNVTADDAALRLAEERGISLREYDIIYKLTDDVKAALEGRLKPIEEIVHLGRAVVRQTFKVGKVGTIAGCYVTLGQIERSARVRVIREGTVVFPSGEKVVGLDSLKRFKDDAKEVREGFECGLKITGYDDIKVGDVIEAFKIESRARTL
jgi:translation initiation factor IF-2